MGEQEGAVEIEVDQALPFGEGQLVDPCAGIGDDRAAADGVDQDVDPAEFLLDGGDCGLYLPGIERVAKPPVRLAACAAQC